MSETNDDAENARHKEKMRKHKADLRMSKQEIREEMKETDGNPQVKGRIRRLQRQVRRRQMLKETEKATVVIVNPTHFAIAVQYLPNMRAPIVLAKGRDHLAQEIKDVARWHNIPIMENPPLERLLSNGTAFLTEKLNS